MKERQVMNGRFAPMAVAVLLGSLAGACSFTGDSRTATVRFRVEVALVDKGAERRGSGVWSFTLSKPLIAMAGPYNARFDAEAIPIRLDDQTWAFVLPGTVGNHITAAQWPERAFGLTHAVRGGSDGVRALSELSKSVGRSVDIECRPLGDTIERVTEQITCPSIVVTKNLNDVMSFREITDQINESAEHKAIAVARLRITVTDQPTTRIIDDMLPWLRWLSKISTPPSPKYYAIEQSLPSAVKFVKFPYYNNDVYE